jgi:hypothetical protein
MNVAAQKSAKRDVQSNSTHCDAAAALLSGTGLNTLANMVLPGFRICLRVARKPSLSGSEAPGMLTAGTNGTGHWPLPQEGA